MCSGSCGRRIQNNGFTLKIYISYLLLELENVSHMLGTAVSTARNKTLEGIIIKAFLYY